jgi:hypothetical protein
MLRTALVLWTVAGAAIAQGSFYVDGALGIDAPGRGQVGAPWKTIGYALANVPAQTLTTSAVVWVEGNQVYSPATNGETFPLSPVYNVAIQGRTAGHGKKATLRVPSGGTAMVFASGVVFNRNQVTISEFVIEGGDYGMQMGAAPGFRHRPRVQYCVFDGQAQAPVRIDNAGAAIQDPRFFQNTFKNGYKGMMLYSAGTGAITRPDVEECRFEGFSNAAIEIEDRSPGGGSVGGLFRSNWFDQCGTGIRIRSAAGAVTTAATIRTSRFADIATWAVDVQLDYPFDPLVTVQDCAMLRCGGGVRLTGTPLPGAYTLNVLDNAIVDCGTGLGFSVVGQGDVDVVTRDNLIENCGYGVDFLVGSTGGAGLLFDFDSQRDRILRGGTGVRMQAGAPGTVAFGSGMICGNGSGVQAITPYDFVLRSMTLADNQLGLNLFGTPGPGSRFEHLLFGGNGVDFAPNAALAMTHSCFQGSTWPGVGNLNFTDPQLQRPTYKLAPTSPCIDAGSLASSLPSTDYEGDPRASVGVAAGAAVPDIGADEYVYAGSARTYGTPGFGLGNVFPRMSSPSANAPIGSNVQLDLTGASYPFSSTPAKFAVCAFGVRDDHGTAPFDLAPFGFSGSYLWTETLGAFPLQTISLAGTASLLHPIPNDLGLVGATLTYQWIAIMPLPTGVVTSDALRVTLGR